MDGQMGGWCSWKINEARSWDWIIKRMIVFPTQWPPAHGVWILMNQEDSLRAEQKLRGDRSFFCHPLHSAWNKLRGIYHLELSLPPLDVAKDMVRLTLTGQELMGLTRFFLAAVSFVSVCCVLVYFCDVIHPPFFFSAAMLTRSRWQKICCISMVNGKFSHG